MLHSICVRAGALLPLCLLLLDVPSAQAWERILPEHFGRYDLPPSRFGYPLDDFSASYYGGGRYREYYAFGRGYGIANFPPPVPADPWTNWVPRGIPFGKYAHTSSVPVNTPTSVPAVSHLTIVVPPQADVWLEGQRMSQAGPTRTFVSPPLNRGQRYLYEVRVRWLEQGEEKTETRSVYLFAGERVTTRFPDSERTQPALLPALQPTALTDAPGQPAR